MKTLTNDRFAPITSRVGFLQAPTSTVLDAYLAWVGPERPADVERIDGTFPDVLRRLEPLVVAGTEKFMLLQNGEWTAYFDDFVMGTDARSFVRYLAQQIGCLGVTVTVVPHEWHPTKRPVGRLGGTQFTLYGPLETEWLNMVRSVNLINNGPGWEWSQSGQIQPYEETDRYSAIRKSQRLDADMLERYCAALGISLFDEASYVNPILIHQWREVVLQMRSLEQVQATLDIRHP